MSTEFHYGIAGIDIYTYIDFHTPVSFGPTFEKFEIPIGPCGERHFFYAVDSGELNQPYKPLEDLEKEFLLHTVSFPHSWLKNPMLRVPRIRRLVAGSGCDPEMTEIELAWNRLVIRDYTHHESYVFYPPERKLEFSNPILIAGYRNLIEPHFPGFGMVMIHASGIIRNGMALVFLAPDSGGKTTVARLAGTESVLSDDQIVVSENEYGFDAHATPFFQISNGPRKAEIGGIFILEKDLMFGIEPIDRHDMVSFIWENMFTKCYLPESLNDTVQRFLFRLTNRVKLFRLRFSRDHIDWPAIDRAVQS